MSIGKWKWPGSRKQSTASAGNINTATASSSSSTSRTSTPASPASTGGNSSRSSKTSLSSSPFSWFRSPHRLKARKSTISRDDPAYARLHKPFTPQNLEHQKVLSAFEWNFGGNDDDNGDNADGCRRRRRQSSLSISPCATRNNTVDDYPHESDYGRAPDEQFGRDHKLPLRGPEDALSGSLARLSMREGPGEGYDRADAA
ncbi:hypothetical protein F5Y12DRAFT_727447 [Xylaria sp. FL1777]|nr:hypothetical protein F5Y12DRAFT_727447 [Xylaria sp. FL1777]